MLDSNTDGLKSLHRVLIAARSQAYENAPPAVLADILDTAEVLVAYLISDKNDTEHFKIQLRGLGEQYPTMAGISRDFESGEP